MGRTIPSYRISLMEELKRWRRFQEVLRMDERAIFQDMMDECIRHASAAGAACSPSIADAMFLTILFAHHQALKQLQERITELSKLARPENQFPPNQHA